MERWARLAGGDISTLSPEEIADAAVHFLDEDLIAALKANGYLKLRWDRLLGYIRGHLGLTLVDLQIALV